MSAMMPQPECPEYDVCARYFGMSQAMYEPVAQLLQWLQSDAAGAAMLSNMRDALLNAKNVPAASAVLSRLRDYVTVFYSAEYAHDDTDCAATAPAHGGAHTDTETTAGAPSVHLASDLTLAAAMVYCLQQSVQAMQSEGIPGDIIEATLRDFAIWARVYQSKTGRMGIGETDWNLLSLTGNILRIGRLQYESITFLEPYMMYRHKQQGSLVVFAVNGLRVRSDGHLQGANGVCTDDGFTTVLSAEGRTVTGNPVDIAQGTIQAEPVSINQRNYDLLLAPGMPTTSVHIPEGGSLSPEAVDESLAQAAQLLDQLGRSTPTLFCESWLLDPNLESLESPSSNVCRFMRRFAIFPVASVHPMIVERVFGWGADALDVHELPERSSLQRNLKHHLLQGGVMYDVGGVMVIS